MRQVRKIACIIGLCAAAVLMAQESIYATEVTETIQIEENQREAQGSTWLSNYTYAKDDVAHTVTLSLYIGTDTEITIPGTVTIDGTDYQVVLENNKVFTEASNASLASISFTGGVIAPEKMSKMFAIGSLKAVDLSGLNTASVKSMSKLFYNAYQLESINLANLNTTKVTDMSSMFQNCMKLTSLDVSSLNTDKVTDMSSMFNDCRSLISLDLSGFHTQAVTTMRNMFAACRNLSSLNLSGFDTSKVTEMYGMFHMCSGLTTLNLNSFDTSSVYTMENMFAYCDSLTSLDLSGFNMSNVTSVTGMFKYCVNLSTDITFTGAVARYWECFTGAATAGNGIVMDYAGACSYDMAKLILATASDNSKVTMRYVNKTASSERIGGQDRFETAILCAEEMKTTDKYHAVVLANAYNFPDALAGCPLAAEKDAPILLVGSEEGNQKTYQYILNNVAADATIYLLGETSAIPSEVTYELKANGYNNIVRLGGQDRYQTNMKIVNEMNIAVGSDIVVASGTGYADSLSISGVAGYYNMPIFLVGDTISTETLQKINEINPRHIYIVGGTAVVNENIQGTLNAYGTVVRLAGEDRYKTSVAVAQYFGSSDINRAVIAYGGNFPDGLTGGVLAAKNHAPVILVSGDNYSEQTAFIGESNISSLYVMGGTALISDEVVSALEGK